MLEYLDSQYHYIECDQITSRQMAGEHMVIFFGTWSELDFRGFVFKEFSHLETHRKSDYDVSFHLNPYLSCDKRFGLSEEESVHIVIFSG